VKPLAELLHRVADDAVARADLGPATAEPHAGARPSPWSNAPGSISGSHCRTERRRAAVRLAAILGAEGRQFTPPRSVGHGTLVIAIESATNDFGAPGVAKYAVPPETPAQAERFNRRLANACLCAQTRPEPARLGQLHVAIDGAGATRRPAGEAALT
jgi:hypothetical protein